MVQILGKSVKNWMSNCSSKIWSQNSAEDSKEDQGVIAVNTMCCKVIDS